MEGSSPQKEEIYIRWTERLEFKDQNQEETVQGGESFRLYFV